MTGAILDRGIARSTELPGRGVLFRADVSPAAADTGNAARLAAIQWIGVAMACITLAQLTQIITPLAHRRGDDLAAAVVERTGITSRRARALLSELVALGWLVCEGSPRRPRYRAGPLRQVVRQYALQGLAEDRAWAHDFAPHFDTLPAEVRRMAQHAFTELLNNAVDHSGGAWVTATLRQTATQMQLLLSDDGLGLFDKIAADFEIDDAQLAMFELGKGKLTSAPTRHTGRGLYFTARLADVFDLHANANAFQRRDWEPGGWRAARALLRRGTSIYLAIALDTPRTLDGVMRSASADGAGYGFERTQVPLGLLAGATGVLESRAQARRVGARLAQFQHVELDFSGVIDVGHAFADELFRVIPLQQHGLDLRPLNAPPRVATLIASVSV